MSSSSSSSSTTSAAPVEKMWMAIFTVSATTFSSEDVDDALSVECTGLHRTREKCLREMWTMCVEQEHIASSAKAFVDNLDDRSRYDLEWLLDPTNDEEVAQVCRRLIPTAHHARPEEMSKEEFFAHLLSLRLSRAEFDLVMYNLSWIASEARQFVFTYELKELAIPMVSAEVVEHQDMIHSLRVTNRKQQELLADLRVSNARSKLQCEVLRQQLDCLHRQLEHLRSRNERHDGSPCASRRRLNFENV
jgi:hypothetical protein